jgi:hypothetical protein
VLVDTFGIAGITDVENDIKIFSVKINIINLDIKNRGLIN